MRHTNQQPFRFDLRQAAQQKLPKASYMFDLRKDWFDDHFSFAEHLAPGFAAQLVPHPFLQGGVFWQSFRTPIKGLTSGHVASGRVPPNQPKPLDWGPEALPENATLQERMWHKLRSKAGREVFSKRKVIVEPVFAQIKHVRGFRQFLLRGLAQVEAEWLLVCMTHNLMKMFRATKQLQLA